MLDSKEHYDLMAEFEKLFRSQSQGGMWQFRGRVERERDKALWAKGYVYENGEVNQQFLAFRAGYMLGKAANE